jgi:hypothetical protein
MRARSTLSILIAVSTMAITSMAACKDCDDAPKTKDAAAPASTSSSSALADASADAAAPAKEAGPPAEAGAAIPFDEDAGPSACKLTYGPSELLFRGPAAMIVDNAKNELRLVANDNGKPRIFTVALDAKTPPPPPAFMAMRWPPCEVAGKFVYCQGHGGSITRTALGTNETKTVVTKSRAARIAAAPLGSTGEHSVVAFLDTKQTSEGAMIQLFALMDEDTTPTRLSEDGAGATTMRLVSRGADAVAVYLDTRTAMVPVHARTIKVGGKDGKDLAFGDDVVAFVGGAPERGIDLTLGGVAGKLFVLLPMPRETTDFGMAAIPVLDPPKDDVAATWSLYPNGLDPAPIGATLDGWVARVRPREKMPGSKKVLELGRIDDKGAFTSLGLIADKPITDVALATDSHKGVWIMYGDASATFLERRVCP